MSNIFPLTNYSWQGSQTFSDANFLLNSFTQLYSCHISHFKSWNIAKTAKQPVKRFFSNVAWIAKLTGVNFSLFLIVKLSNEFICGWDTEHCDKVFEFVVCVGSIFLLHKKQPNVDGFRSRMFLSSISYQDFFSNSTPPEPYQPFYTIFPFWLRKKGFRYPKIFSIFYDSFM